MSDPQAALATQVRNIQAKTGKTIDELRQLLQASGLSKHGEKRTLLMQTFGLGYGDANTAVHAAAGAITMPAAAPASAAAAGAADAAGAQAPGDPLDAIYAGNKAHLRPLHEAVLAMIAGFGDFERAPKKTYISLRRRKQFAMVGPATKDAIEVGLNAKDLPAHARLKAMPPGGMCAYTVRLSDAKEIDATLRGWLRKAFDAAA